MIVVAVVLLVVALVFVMAELFLPSHGVLSIVAALAALASVVIAFRANTTLGMLFALAIIVATPIVVVLAVKIYPRTAVGRRVMLDANASGAAADAFAREAAKLQELVGQQGVAMTMLRPAGSIEIAGRRVDALSESEMIDPGAAVEVVRVSGLKVFVKAV